MQDSDVIIRVQDRVGRITLNRPKALNALTSQMALAIEAALDQWELDENISVVIIDATGDRAFCAGGDIAELYQRGLEKDFGFGRAFWRQEYQLNAKIAGYRKPIVAFLQGFTMGGGVGIGCHASHRIVCDDSLIAMPECSIGLVPDVGGSMLLGKAPGHCGAYLGLTGSRMGPGDAIYAGFADHFIAFDHWQMTIDTIIAFGSVEPVGEAASPAPASLLQDKQEQIDQLFGAENLGQIAQRLAADSSEFAQKALTKLSKGSPLSLACALRLINAASNLTIEAALMQEYRFVFRSQELGEFNEGIRAQIIERDQNPAWRHTGFDVPTEDIDEMLASLEADEWAAS